MNAYKDLYYYLFNQISDISQELIKMQQTAEEMFLSSDDSQDNEPNEED